MYLCTITIWNRRKNRSFSPPIYYLINKIFIFYNAITRTVREPHYYTVLQDFAPRHYTCER